MTIATQNSSKPMTRRRTKPANLRIESLEQRLMLSDGLNAIRHYSSTLEEGKYHARFNLKESMINSESVILDFTIHSEDGDDPKFSGFTNRDGDSATEYGTNPQSYVLLVTPGRLRASVRAAGDLFDPFQISISLAGDVDGNFKVTGKDILAIRSLNGMELGDSDYLINADVDQNGMIEPRDRRIANLNRGTKFKVDTRKISVDAKPSIHNHYYEVPDTGNDPALSTFEWVYQEAQFKNELGLFEVDDSSGTINGLRPTDKSYAEAALSSPSRQIIFSSGKRAGVSTTLELPSNSHFGLYLVQNGALQPNGTRSQTVFFSDPRINPEGFDHFRKLSGNRFAFEDQNQGGDRDFDDLVARISFESSAKQNLPPTLGPTPNRRVAENSTIRFNIDATDPDDPRNQLDIELNGVPEGTLFNQVTGEFSWTPTESQGPGRTRISVKVTDPQGASKSDVFIITVNETQTAPQLQLPQPITVSQGESASFRATASDQDIPANNLSFALTQAPDGSSIDPVTGDVHWTTSQTDTPGEYDFIVKVIDDGPGKLSDTQSVTVTLLADNSTPELAVIPVQEVDEKTPLSFFANLAGGAVGNVQYAFLGDVPSGINIDQFEGEVTWTPTEEQGPGQYIVTVGVTNSAGLSDQQDVNITVREVNEAPLIDPISDKQVVQGEPTSVQFIATDPDIPLNTLTCSVLNAPDGSSFNGQTCTLDWTPSASNDPGEHIITAKVVDDGIPKRMDLEEFTVTVIELNQPPVLDPIEGQQVAEQRELSFTATATDPNPNSTLTFSLGAGSAVGAAIDPVSGIFSWTPLESDGPGSYTVDIVVTDNGLPSLSASTSVAVAVAEQNSQPTVTPETSIPNTVAENESIQIQFVATDLDQPDNGLVFDLPQGESQGATIDPVTGLFSWTANQSGDHAFTVRVTDDGSPQLDDEFSFTLSVADCGFNDGLAEFRMTQLNGSLGGQGSVVAEDCSAVITEGDSFIVTLEKDFIVEPNSALRIQLDSPLFDETDSSFINDSFELALLDESGNSLVKTYGLGHDAFLNITESNPLNAAEGIEVASRDVTVGLNGLVPDTMATVVLRVINNDIDTTSSVTIRNLDIITSSQEAILPNGSTSFESLRAAPPVSNGTLPVTIEPVSMDLARGLLGLSSPRIGQVYQAGQTVLISGRATTSTQDAEVVSVAINGRHVEVMDPSGLFFDRREIAEGTNSFDIEVLDTAGNTSVDTLHITDAGTLGQLDPLSRLDDITSHVDGLYQRTSWNDAKSELLVELAVEQDSGPSLFTPSVVLFDNIDDPNILVLNQDGSTHDGVPYVSIESFDADEKIRFFNPSEEQFRYDLTLLGSSNSSPYFVTVPIIETTVPQQYTYPSSATDPDSDIISYSLTSSPDGMRIDSATGSITWQPDEADRGVHNIHIIATDSFGNSVEQVFNLYVIDSIPNRPPIIISQPETFTTATDPYKYGVVATDADGDVLTYELVETPDSISIDTATGRIDWDPSLNDVGSHPITVKVTDGNDGTATQQFVLCVHDASANRPPTIISSPIRTIGITDPSSAVPNYSYTVAAVDADDDILSYSLIESPVGMVINSQTGSIQWQALDDIFDTHAHVFGDSEFLDTDWDIVTVFEGGASSSTATQSLTDGNPGAYRSVRLNQGATSTQQSPVYATHRLIGMQYDPSLNGSLHSIDFAMDTRRITTIGVNAGLVVFQNGRIYVSPNQGVTQSAQWTPFGKQGFTARDFDLLQVGEFGLLNEAINPDFSESGGAIEWGFYLTSFSGVGSATWTTLVDVDNFEVRATASPDVPVSVQVNDSRGGLDQQQFSISLVPGGTIRGSVFEDSNENGSWDRGGTLLVSDAEKVLGIDIQTSRFENFVFNQPNVLHTRSFSSFTADQAGNLYFTNSPQRVVYRYDVQTELTSVFSSSLELSSPTGIAISPHDGHIYVADEVATSVLRFDGNTGEFIDYFSSGLNTLGILELEFSPDGDLYAYSATARRLYTFDGITGEFVTNKVFSSVSGSTFTIGPDGMIYIAGFNESEVIKYDSVTRSLDVFVPAHAGGVDIVSDLIFGTNDDLYATSIASSSIFRFDGGTGDFVEEITFPELSASDGFAVLPSDSGQPEQGLAGRTVFLDLNNNRFRDIDEPFALSDSTGHFLITDVAPGEYSVVLQHEEGWVQTAATTGIVSVALAETIAQVDFAILRGEDTQTTSSGVTITSIPEGEAAAGTRYTYDVEAFDPLGSQLAFELILGPDGMTIHPTTGTVVWQPTHEQLRSHTVMVRVSNESDARDIQTYTLRAVSNNLAPVIVSSAPTELEVGAAFEYRVEAYDPEGGSLNYELQGPPDGLTIDPPTGVVGWDSVPDPDYPSVILNDSPSGYWRFEETGGSTIADSSGNQLSGDFNGFQFGLDGALSQESKTVGFSGRYAIVDDQLTGQDVTVEAWIKPGQTTSQYAAVMMNTSPSWTDGYGLFELPRNDEIVFFINHFEDHAVSARIQAEQWSHVVGIYDGSTIQLYINGELVDSLDYSEPINHPDYTLLIGTDPLLWTWPGGIDEAAIYEHALTSTQINQHYQLGLNHEVPITVEVTDDRGAVTVQSFTPEILSATLNVSPRITSQPRLETRANRHWSYMPRYVDANYDKVTVNLLDSPAGMTLNQSNVLEWVPGANQIGDHSVSIEFVDSRGASVLQEFILTVTDKFTNVAPWITSKPSQKTSLDHKYTYHAKATDVDNDLLSWSVREAPAGAIILEQTGEFIWTPSDNDLGLHSVTLEVSDGFGGVATQTFDLSVICNNSAPHFTSTPNTVATTDQPYYYSARAVDRENDLVQFSIVSGSAGMLINPLTGLLEWTAPQTGSLSVTLEVRDALGAASIQDFTIVVQGSGTSAPPTAGPSANQPPWFISDPVYVAEANVPYQYDVEVIDPDGQVVSIALASGPSGMSIDSDGLISWTPTQLGQEFVTITAADDQGAKSFQSYQLLVESNSPPAIVSSPPLTVTAGDVYRYAVRAIDLDDDPLTYEFTGAGTDSSVTGYGQLIWRTTHAEVGTHSITVTVTDDHGTSDVQQFDLEVVGDTKPPEIELAVSNTLRMLNEEVLIETRASDNIGVTELYVEIDGNRVELDIEGRSRVSFDTPGDHTITAVAEDAAGNSITADHTVRAIDPSDSEYPFVEILSPEHGDTVTYLTDVVGTIIDDYLAMYRIDFARADSIDVFNLIDDDPDWKNLATGTENQFDTKLATFDPTVLSNDSYVIRVMAEDLNGLITTRGVVIGVSGNAKLGAFELDFTDLSIPVAGIPITINRHYSTLDSDKHMSFGYGWSLSILDGDIRETTPKTDQNFYSDGAFRQNDRVYIDHPVTGERLGFTFKPRGKVIPFISDALGLFYRPVFEPDPGTNVNLYDEDVNGFALNLRPNGTYGGLGGLYDYNPTDYILEIEDGTKYFYDQVAGLKRVVDRNGNELTVRPDGLFHSSGMSIDFVRDSMNRITTIIDPDGGELHYIYDTAGDLVTFANQVNLTTLFTYLDDPAHFVEKIIDPLGREVLFNEFDDAGRLVSSTDALGNVVSQSFGTENFTGFIRDANGNTTNLAYDARGNVTEEIDALGSSTFYEYGDALNPDLETKITDRNGNVTERFYDSRGNLLDLRELGSNSAPLSEPAVTQFAYNGDNNIASITNSMGRKTQFEYDSRGNLSTIVNADGDSARFEYDQAGLRRRFYDFRGNPTTLIYSTPLLIPTATIFADDTFKTSLLNARGLETSSGNYESDSTLVEETTTRYDFWGRVIATFDGEGNEVRNFYVGHLLDYEVIVNPDSLDADGRLLESPVTPVLDRKSRITDYEYDELNRLIRQTDAMGGVVEFRYDANGNRTLLQDPVGNITTWVYDAVDRVLEERDPFYNAGMTIDEAVLDLQNLSGADCNTTTAAEHVRLICYDPEGNRSKTIDRNARIREFDYDHASRLLVERWYDPDRTLVRTINFTYDLLGNMLTASDPDSSYAFTYDTVNRLTSVDNNPDGTRDVPHVVLTYDYDAQGNVILTQDNFGVTVESTYNDRNLLESRTWYDADIPTGETVDVDDARVDFAYDAAGRESEIRRYSDLLATTLVGRTVRSYDLAGRSDLLTHLDDVDELMAGYDYDYDFSGLLTHEQRSHRDAQYEQGIEYGYDLTGQLLDALFSGQAEEHYEYDLNGNRVSSQVGTDERSYSTGPANQLTGDGKFNYEYDGEGNLVRRIEINDDGTDGVVRTLEYDHQNRLVRVDDWTSTSGDLKNAQSGSVLTRSVQYLYDALERRIARSVDAHDDTQESQHQLFTYDGDNAWIDSTQSGAVQVRYLTGSTVDSTIANSQVGTEIKWYLPDRLGTMRDRLLQDSSAVHHLGYRTFGGPIAYDAKTFERHTFTGREFDPVTWNYHLRTRTYDPHVGRFLSQDTIGFDALDANLFRYVFNDPINGFDPTGETLVGFAVAAGVGFAVFALLDCLSPQEFFEGSWCDTFKPYVGGREIWSTVLGASGGAAVAKIFGGPASWFALIGVTIFYLIYDDLDEEWNDPQGPIWSREP